MAEKTYTRGDTELHQSDFLEGVKRFDEDTFDLAIADPPYGASTTAEWSLPEDHGLPGFGGEWNIAGHEWDIEKGGIEGFDFVLAWLSEIKRVVKPTGSLWVHSTYHNSGIVNVACQMLDIEIINEVVWYKRNAFPNLSGRRITASHENILWCHTGDDDDRRYRFNYEDVKSSKLPSDQLNDEGKQLRTVWDVPTNKKKAERRYDTHPTQKPLRIVRRLLLVAGLDGGRLLVPFAGSGTAMVAGIKYGMSAVGFEIDEEFYDIAENRVDDAISKSQKTPTLFDNVEK